MILSSLPDPVTIQAERLRADFGLHPVTASEIEFYLTGPDHYSALPAFWDEVKAACADAGISLFKTEKERGREQHEISLQPCSDPLKTAKDTQSLRYIIQDKASAHGLEGVFSSRPFSDQPGSGLHIHVHLAQLIPPPTGGRLGGGQSCSAGNLFTQEQAGPHPNPPPMGEGIYRNVFYKDDASISDPLKYSIGGLLARMLEDMPVFAPNPESYARFTPGSNAPLTVSWGANNRTTAIRLPDSAHGNKRIEHRVAGADADPESVIAAILAAMHYGLINRVEPGPQVYGDASLEMYGLPKLVIPA